MDDWAHADSLRDDELVDALGRTLRVDPSPAFLPRVRMRVAQEVPAPRWRGYSPIVVAVALVLLVSVAITIDRRHMTPTANVLDESRVFDSVAEHATAVRQDSGASTLAPSGRVAQRMTPISPEVVISRDESAAIERLLQQGLKRPLTVSTDTRVVPASDNSAAADEILILPIAIEPLDSPATSEGTQP